MNNQTGNDYLLSTATTATTPDSRVSHAYRGVIVNIQREREFGGYFAMTPFTKPNWWFLGDTPEQVMERAMPVIDAVIEGRAA